MKTRILAALLAVFLPVASSGTVQAQNHQTLTVFAAASLTDAFEEIGTAFQAEHPGVEVTFNFDGSSKLAAQLAEGAPADVFASANAAQMTAAYKAGRIAAPIRYFARNKLVIAVPASNPAGIQSLRDLAKPGVLLVVAAPGVPVRDYADKMLQQLAGVPDYGENYRQAVIKNIVSEETDVRQVIAKVALGEADAGIVYSSDITPDVSSQVTPILIPDKYNTIASYPMVATNDAADPDLAQAFILFVRSQAGQDILAHWGFIPVRQAQAAHTP